jgi:hypothetical protein
MVSTLLANDATCHTFFNNNHRLVVYHITRSDLVARLHSCSSTSSLLASHTLTCSLACCLQLPCTLTTPTSAQAVPLLRPSAQLPVDAAPSCPSFVECRHTYETLYLSSILDTLQKHNAKYLPGGEYTTTPSLHHVHIQTSTRSVERVFSDVDRQFKSRGPALWASLLSALIAAHEATDIGSYFKTYQERFKVLHLVTLLRTPMLS